MEEAARSKEGKGLEERIMGGNKKKAEVLQHAIAAENSGSSSKEKQQYKEVSQGTRGGIMPPSIGQM